MTVQELIDTLEAVEDKTRLMVMAKDTEGNAFSPLWQVRADNDAYKADSTYSGEIGLERITDDLRKQNYSEEDIIHGGVLCAILWPTN